MQVDLADDRFDITYDPNRVAVTGLLESIRTLDYKPEVVARASVAGRAAPTHIELAELPRELADTFAAARKSNKVVLVRFSGPG